MNTAELIKSCEERYNSRLKSDVEAAIAKKSVFIMVTGASCAGKTTTTKKLREYFSLHGVHAETISLDDFYLDHDRTPRDEDGNPDFETIHSLDLPLLDSVMSGLAAGKMVRVPRFDFNTKCRSDEYEELSLDAGEVVIIEGLHALNPLLFSHVPADMVYRVYLYAEADGYDVKLLRRIVRDSYFRSADAKTTLSMWEAVREGEQKYIKPYINDADTVINTFFDYETRLLAAEGLRLLAAVPYESPYRKAASELAAHLEGLDGIPYSDVPDDSLMLEFIKRNA